MWLTRSAETVEINDRARRSVLHNSALLWDDRCAALLGERLITGVSRSFSQAVATLSESIGLCAIDSWDGAGAGLSVLSLLLLALAAFSATV